MTTCKAVKQDGDPCTAKALQGRDFCFFHDPDNATKAKEAQTKGGASKPVLTVVKSWRGQPGEDGETTTIQTPRPDEIVCLLADTIDEVKTGQIDPKIANAVGYLAGVMLKALQHEALEERLQAIEEAIQTKRP